METVIDWSEAPEGCLEIGKNQWDELAWLCADGYIYLHCNGCMVNWKTPRALKRSDFHVFDIRPEDEWTGEGLPPVGTVCEQNIARSDWCETTILAHSAGSRVCAGFQDMSGQLGWSGNISMFRPIRTPEQIAAEERDAAIQVMRDAIGWKAPQLGPCPVAQLYDANYRKQVEP